MKTIICWTAAGLLAVGGMGCKNGMDWDRAAQWVGLGADVMRQINATRNAGQPYGPNGGYNGGVSGDQNNGGYNGNVPMGQNDNGNVAPQNTGGFGDINAGGSPSTGLEGTQSSPAAGKIAKRKKVRR